MNHKPYIKCTVVTVILIVSGCSRHVEKVDKWFECETADGESFKAHSSTIKNVVHNPLTGFISYEITDTDGWTRTITSETTGLKCREISK